MSNTIGTGSSEQVKLNNSLKSLINEGTSHLVHLRHTLEKLTKEGPQTNIHLQLNMRRRHFITATGEWTPL